MTRPKFGFFILYQCQCRQNQVTGCNPKHDMFEHVGFNRESFHHVGTMYTQYKPGLAQATGLSLCLVTQ